MIVENLVKHYPGEVTAVDGVSFTVRGAEIFVFLGPNGAGKSTTIKILTTLDLQSGWLKTAARFYPITYVLEAMRALINSSWDGAALWQAVFACLLLAVVTYTLAIIALRVRTRRV